MLGARATPALTLTLLAAVLFAGGLGTHPIGRDEAVSILAARHSEAALLALVAAHEPHPAGYYLALSLWPHATLLEARLFSFLPALACVPVVILAATRLGLPRWPAGILAATAPFLGFYAVEARMYSWLALLGAVALLLTLRVTTAPGPGIASGVAAGVALALAAYVHYFAAFTGLAVIAWLLIARRPRAATAALSTATLLYLPGLLLLYEQIPLLRRYPSGTWQAREDPAHVFQALSVLLAGAESYLPAFLATAIFVAVIGWALYRGRTHPGVRLLAFWLLSTMALPLAIGAVVPLDSPRYLAAAFPALVLLLAAAGAGLDRRRLVGGTAILAVLGAALVVDSQHRQDNTKPPLPAALALAEPGRLIVAQHLLLAPEVAFYRPAEVAYGFNPPVVDRVGYWALPPGAAYPPSPPRPLLVVNYCGRLTVPAGYTAQPRVRFSMNLCALRADPSG